jgi:pimeloyl-ACP methyl ester carboxylesterase
MLDDPSMAASDPVTLPAPFPADVRRLATPDGSVTLYEAGAGAPVLLLHSINAAASAMEVEPLFTTLARSRRVVAVDWVGFGRSDRPAIDYRPAVYRRVLAAVLDDLPDPAVDVVALSLASQVAAVTAAEEPSRIRRLVAIAPTGIGRFGVARHPTRGRIVETVLRRTPLGRLLFRTLTTRRSIDGFMNQVVLLPESIPAAYRTYAWRTAHQPGAHHAPIAFVSGQLDDPTAGDAWRSLTVPTLLLFGDSPRFSDPAAMREGVGGNTCVTVETIQGSGDLPHWEQPAQTVERIERFLSVDRE